MKCIECQKETERENNYRGMFFCDNCYRLIHRGMDINKKIEELQLSMFQRGIKIGTFKWTLETLKGAKKIFGYKPLVDFNVTLRRDGFKKMIMEMFIYYFLI